MPELADLLDDAQHGNATTRQVRIVRGTETQTLSVRVAGEIGSETGFVLTFDDISAQLADQRRAAWADVARRIAHEIKNPLTPIQLAAERLQRKYGRQIAEDPETFAVLTATIVRQVGDLRRMVDEFSDFARLPKPMFGPENLDAVVRQALVLQEVAYPGISYVVEGSAAEALVCDRQQLARALTNLLKNAAEAVTTRIERDTAEGLAPAPGRITIAIADSESSLTVTITDNGIGLPIESRARLTEPYVTTRARGTGLGLAIVKKIIEDHGGSLELGDAPVDPAQPDANGAFARARLSRAMIADSARFDSAQAESALPEIARPFKLTA